MTLSDTTGDDLTPGSGSWGRQSWVGRGGGLGSKGGKKSEMSDDRSSIGAGDTLTPKAGKVSVKERTRQQ